MDERPILPLETQSAIERAREQIYSMRMASYDLVFGFGRLDFFRAVGAATGQEPLRKPATLKLQLQRYSSALFDIEAKFYLRRARTEAELRSWLNALAACVEAEVMKEASGNFHCTAEQRQEAILDALKQRIDYWIKAAETDPKVTGAWEWTRRGQLISSANLQATRPAGAKRSATMQAPEEQAARIDPKTLRNSYFGSFPEKIVVLDVCWAAKQRYREWMRWLGGKLKDGSKPDRAFRAVLTSGLRPEQYRPGAARPKGWK
jgi:hypothetical protein